MRMPKRPNSPAFLNNSRGKMPCSSHSAAKGAMSSLQKRVTVWRMRSCSSVKYGNSVVCCGTVCVLMGGLHGLNFYQHLPGGHNLPRLHQDGRDHAIHGGIDILLHFHGFQHHQNVTGLHPLAWGDENSQYL